MEVLASVLVPLPGPFVIHLVYYFYPYKLIPGPGVSVSVLGTNTEYGYCDPSVHLYQEVTLRFFNLFFSLWMNMAWK